MKRIIVILCLVTMAAAACGRDPSATPTDRPGSTPTHHTPTPTPTPTPNWAGPGPLSKDGSVDVTFFNTYVDEVDAGWTRSPLRMALEFLALGDPSEGGAFKTIAEQQASPEGGTQATVVVTQQGLLDDSVQAIQFMLEFENQGDRWVLLSGTWGQRCQQGRGHQDFTPEPCV